MDEDQNERIDFKEYFTLIGCLTIGVMNSIKELTESR